MLTKSTDEKIKFTVNTNLEKVKGSIALLTKEYDTKKTEDENDKKHILCKEEITVEAKEKIAEYEFTVKEISQKHDIKLEDVYYVKGHICAKENNNCNIEGDKEVFVRISQDLITKDMLRYIGCTIKEEDLEELVKALNKYCRIYDIYTPIRIAHFLSQAGHESGGFEDFVELDNFRHEAAIVNLRKYRELYEGKSQEESRFFVKGEKFLKQPELFNFAYANTNGNGDEKSGDGSKYLGRGIMHITGRGKYKDFTVEYNKMKPEKDPKLDFVDNPELVAKNMDCVVASACWFWRKKGATGVDINKIIDKNKFDVLEVSRAVNGGKKGTIPNGYDKPGDRLSRLPLFNKLKEYLKL